MDDYLSSTKTVEEATALIQDVIFINKHANFIMHSWASNDDRVLISIENIIDKKQNEKNSLCDRGVERVLGLFWNNRPDFLSFNVGLSRIPQQLLTGAINPTKCEFLKIIMSNFDPLGLLGPFTLQSKILMQEIWYSGVGWDEPIRDQKQIGWLQWATNFRNISSCSVPRCHTPKSDFTNVQLHVFCDASLKSHTAVAYLRFAVTDDSFHVSLVMAKIRVASLKPMNVPRLELQATLLGARLLNTVIKEVEIKIDQRFFMDGFYDCFSMDSDRITYTSNLRRASSRRNKRAHCKLSEALGDDKTKSG